MVVAMSRTFALIVLAVLVSVGCTEDELEPRPSALGGEGGEQAVPGRVGAQLGDDTDADQNKRKKDKGGKKNNSNNDPEDAPEMVPADPDPLSSPLTWDDTCGDGVLNTGEACDDGARFPGDGCSEDCCIEQSFDCCDSPFCYREARTPCHCGDGVVDLDEECDDGNLASGDGCSGYCTEESGDCANGQLDPGEECDDGNLEAADGCDPACRAEAGCN